MAITQKETYPFNVPEPKDEVEQKKPGDKLTAAERMRKAYYEGLEIEAFRKGVGLDQSGRQGGEDTSGVNQILVTTMQSYSNALTSLIQELIKAQSLASGSKQPGESEFFKYLIGEVKEMKTKMEGGQGDPFDLIDQYHTRMQKWQADIQARSGTQTVPGAAQGGVEALKVTLQIEQLKLEADERRRQFDLDLAERRHRWEVEDKKWNADFQLKLRELGVSQEQSARTSQTFGDLLASVLDSMEPSAPPVAGGPPVVTQAAKETAEPIFPDVVKCDGCGNEFPWPKGQMRAVCPTPGCGADYTLEKKQ